MRDQRRAVYSTGTQPAIDRPAMRPEYVLILVIIVVMVVVLFIALDRNDQEH